MGKPSTSVSRELQELDAVERVTHRIRTEGIEAALDALLGVCRDEKSAAPARSSAGTAIFRAAGFFDTNREDVTKKAPSEMSPQELAAALQKLKRELSERSTPDEDEVDADAESELGEGDNKGPLFD